MTVPVVIIGGWVVFLVFMAWVMCRASAWADEAVDRMFAEGDEALAEVVPFPDRRAS